MLDWDRRTQIIVLVVAAALLFGAGVKYANFKAGNPEVASVNLIDGQKQDTLGNQGETGGEIWVHVSGAVMKPGLYQLPSGSRVNDAVSKAVPAPDAHLDALNLAEKLSDGQKLPVPLKGEETAAASLAEASGAVNTVGGGKKININTASESELQTLPGIGPKLAERIVSYRVQSGPFRTIDDIVNISGIGEARFEQIKDLITVY